MLRATSSIAILAGVCVAALSGGQAPAQGEPVAASPEFRIEVTGSHVRINGDVSSFAHEAILRQTLLKRFEDSTADVQLTVTPALPPGWALVTELALAAMAETTSGKASINPAGIEIRGITSDESLWTKAASRLASNLLPDMQFRPQVAEIRRAGTLQRQCLELFRTALRGRRIEFAHSSAQLRSSVSPVLDELVQIATDCPGSRIEVTGHTDASGDESGNLALSQARAHAVAAHFIEAGIQPERLTATGVGSSDPLVQDDSARARQLNRRIDVEIRYP